MSRFVALLYGFTAYAIALGSLLYAAGFTTGLVVPKTVDTGDPLPLGVAIAIDSLLVSLFALQHSIMARPWFKFWWTKFERSSYVLFSGLILILMMWQWQPMTGIVWSITVPSVVTAITVLSLFGWVLAVASTFLINHFELFGLQQVTIFLFGKVTPQPIFRTPLLYKIVRHPLYLGLIIAFWAAPTMTVGHLLFAALMTAYIFVGITFEERDLITVFGDEYRRYKARVPKLLPYGARKSEAAPSQSRQPRPAKLGE